MLSRFSSSRSNLGASGLLGSLPESISGLVNLTSIDLSANGLTGPIPSTIGALAKLKRMQLDKNTFEGNLPVPLCEPPCVPSFPTHLISSHLISSPHPCPPTPTTPWQAAGQEHVRRQPPSVPGQANKSYVPVSAIRALVVPLTSNPILLCFLLLALHTALQGPASQNFIGSIPAELGNLTGASNSYISPLLLPLPPPLLSPPSSPPIPSLLPSYPLPPPPLLCPPSSPPIPSLLPSYRLPPPLLSPPFCSVFL
ncbi:unnamed protein product [Closterium sp. NIES-54]